MSEVIDTDGNVMRFVLVEEGSDDSMVPASLSVIVDPSDEQIGSMWINFETSHGNQPVSIYIAIDGGRSIIQIYDDRVEGGNGEPLIELDATDSLSLVRQRLAQNAPHDIKKSGKIA